MVGSMTKTHKKFDDPAQLSLLDLLKAEREERVDVAPGSLCVSARLMSAVK